MSTTTDLTVIESGAFPALARPLDEVRDILRDTIGEDANLSEFDLPTVKIPPAGSTRWVVPSPMGETVEDELTGVLMAYKRTRAFWVSTDPTGDPPNCRSQDAKVGVPDEVAKQLGAGGACKTCPMSQWGSHPKSDAAQACREREIWMLLREGSFLPLVVSLPPTSLSPAREYRIGVGSAGLRFTDVVTGVRLTTETGPAGKYGVIEARIVGRLDAEDAAKAKAYATELRPIFEATAAAMTAESDIPMEDDRG